MSLLPERYNAVRERLIVLYDYIQNEHFDMFVKPSSLLTVDQLRDRETFNHLDSVADDGYFEEFQDRTLTIPLMLGILPNLIDVGELGFTNANRDLVGIYESIQEYLSLWAELIRNEPRLEHPPIKELRDLEGLAYFLFSTYREIKPFVTNEKQKELFASDSEANKRGLLGLGALMSMKSMNANKGQEEDDESFFSHLDALESTGDTVGGPETHSLFFGSNNLADSIGNVEKAPEDPSWTFRGD